MNSKIIIRLLLMILILYSCAKSNQNNTTSISKSTMTYYFNDSLVTMRGNGTPYINSFPYLHVINSSDYATLGGHDSCSNSSACIPNDILINFIHDTTIQNSLFYVKDSFQVQTYNFNLQVNSTHNISALVITRVTNGLVRQFGILTTNDYFIFTISRYSDSTIDGTFSGMLSGYGGVTSVAEGQTAIITKGKFSNISVY